MYSLADNPFWKSTDFYKVLHILSFKDMEDVYENNFDELHKVLCNYDTRSKDFYRVLHNYLASFATLTDHCRILLKQCPEAAVEVNKVIQTDLARNDLNSFIKDLRNYILHYSLPLKMQRVLFSDDQLTLGELVLDKNRLNKWDGWSSNSKRWLSENNSNIDIKNILIEHYELLANFYNWLDDYLQHTYSSAFGQYEQLPR